MQYLIIVKTKDDELIFPIIKNINSDEKIDSDEIKSDIIENHHLDADYFSELSDDCTIIPLFEVPVIY